MYRHCGSRANANLRLHFSPDARLTGQVPDATTPSPAPQLEIATPRRFDSRAVWCLNGYGLVLALPVLLAVMAMSALPFGLPAALLPILAILLGAFFLPFGFGNRYVARLVKDATGKDPNPGQFIVQVTLEPRVHSGFRGLLEDADDVGTLTFLDNEFVFSGDSVNLRVPYRSLRSVTRENLGLRGLFVYGSRITLEIDGLPERRKVSLAERSSMILPASWKVTRALEEKLRGAWKAAEP